MSAHNPEVNPEVVFAESFGFCGGVAAADQLAAKVALEAASYGVQAIGYHDIVHNADVTRRHEAAGVTFVGDVSEIPNDSAVIISAHGVGPEVKDAILQTGSEIFDATCPLVTHTHLGVEHARDKNEKVIYVCHGKPGEVDKLHDEVAGMLGHLNYRFDENGQLIEDPVERSYLELDEVPDNEILDEREKYRIITQTTLHADDCLRYREQIKEFIEGQQPNATVEWSNKGDVCRAVSDRQQAVEQLVELRPRKIVVVTDPNSKNGMGYAKLAKSLVADAELDTTVHAVANAEQAVQIEQDGGVVGITASASTPTETINEVAAVLGETNPPAPSDRVFKLPDANPDKLWRRIAALAAKNGGVEHA